MKRELNLLPAQRRKILNRESLIVNATDTIVNVNWLLTAVAVLGLATFGALQFFILITSETVGEELDRQVERYGELRQQIAVQNVLIESMRGLANGRIVWSLLLPDALKAMSPGTSITALNGLEATRTLEIKGNTTSRGAVVVIRQRLFDLPWTTSVEAPTANLINRVDPDFIFKMVIAP